MNELPIESSYSFRNGTWFVFNDENSWIRFWISHKNGKERLYYNNELVKEEKSLTKVKSVHEYQADDKTTYKVELKMVLGLKNGGTLCTFYKDGAILEQKKLKQSKGYMKYFRLIMYPSLIVFGITVVCRTIYNLPVYVFALPIFVFLTLFIIINKKRPPGIVIENVGEEFEVV